MVFDGGGALVNAIFGFCDIRNFTDCTEVLRDCISSLVNCISGSSARVSLSLTPSQTGAPS